jgi:hypothetical protein
MKYILRLLAFPFVLCIIVIKYNYHAIKHAIGVLLYGGEWITYAKEDNHTIHEIYHEIKNFTPTPLSKPKMDDFLNPPQNSFNVNNDPRFFRICPYCKNSFYATHLLQKYCYSKYGKKNYCKNKMKTVNKKK